MSSKSPVVDSNNPAAEDESDFAGYQLNLLNDCSPIRKNSWKHHNKQPPANVGVDDFISDILFSNASNEVILENNSNNSSASSSFRRANNNPNSQFQQNNNKFANNNKRAGSSQGAESGISPGGSSSENDPLPTDSSAKSTPVSRARPPDGESSCRGMSVTTAGSMKTTPLGDKPPPYPDFTGLGRATRNKRNKDLGEQTFFRVTVLGLYRYDDGQFSTSCI
jgi:hypothetical protein